ncbi:hypothetical protein ACMX2H_02280 [Arthrobacter sulfonylureivorans]|uniref:hypothetical protein n=1 Tax=Arthrobacter sulfonylureivorans TaxID=2486855 RepID=UPI0039E5C1AD
MSNQSQPRSRRDIRRQRDGAGPGPESASGTGPQVPNAQANANAPSERGGAAPGDGPAVPRERQGERSSQTRAREREARRALKTLTAALPQVPAPDREQVPTRRQLRQQQLQRENPWLVTDTPAEGAGRDSAGPASGGASTGRASEGASAGSRAGGSGAPVADRVRSAAKPADSGARTSAAPADTPYEPQRPPIEGGRRARRSGDTGRHPVQPAADGQEQLSTAGREAVDAGEMTVEQALAARDLLMGQAKNMVAMMESRQEQSPHDVDLELLAQQKALAERAAVLNRRAADKKRLSEENEQRRHSASDRPIADIASAPMEFVAVPGSDQHVLRPSSTSYVPVVTTPVATPAPKPTAAKPPAPAQAVPARQAAPAQRRPAAPTGKTEASATTRAVPVQPRGTSAPRAAQTAGAAPRSKILAQAEALAGGRGEAIHPLKASSAHGLDPLDARTAGLGRVQRTRLAVGAALVLGAAAFAAGIAMMLGFFGG